MTATVDIVLDDEAGRVQAENLEVEPTTGDQEHAAALVMCAIAGRGLDVCDRRQLERAAALVRPALQALGIVAADEQPGPEQEQSGEHSTCGTPAGYRRHYRLREQPCEECRDAYNAHERATYAPKPLPRQPCGTPTGYKRHYKRRERPCQPCRDAYNAYERDRRKAKRQAR